MDEFNQDYELIGIYYCAGCGKEFEYPTTEEVIKCDNCYCNMYLREIVKY